MRITLGRCPPRNYLFKFLLRNGDAIDRQITFYVTLHLPVSTLAGIVVDSER